MSEQNGRDKKLSVVIPLFNEGSHFAQSFAVIRAEAEKCGLDCEFVLVDDGSQDNTWQVAQELCARNPNARALRLSRNFGKEPAISAGIEYATGDAVVVIDADLQHPPKHIPAMVELWRKGDCDVVDAVRTNRPQESLPRKSGSALFYWLLSKLSGYDISDTCDFKLLDRKVVNAWLRMGETCTFYRGMTEWLGFRHVRLPIEIEKRAGGDTSWSLLRLIALALTATTSFSTIALHLVTLLGIIFIVFAAALGAHTLILWVSGRAIEGFTTVILLQLIIGGCIMLGLGAIGQYLANIYWETKKRPRYVLGEVTGPASKYKVKDIE